MTVPKQWSHGDQPTHTDMNLYATSLNESHSGLGDTALNVLYPAASEATFYLVHTQRYLHFMSNGKLQDPAGYGKETSLSEDDSGYGVLDLESVGWLTYGALYRVTGVSVCCEDWEP
jgi:hypothetical protein